MTCMTPEERAWQRSLFAKAAMQGLVSQAFWFTEEAEAHIRKTEPDASKDRMLEIIAARIGRFAATVADATLAELERTS